LYQKISGYYNFGDVDKLAEGESADTEEYKSLKEKLLLVHNQCNTNLLVARYKLKDYTTVTSLANIILESDPKCTKAYFYKGKALYALENYKEACIAIKKASALEPNNAEIANVCKEITDGADKYFKNEKKKYSKMFQ
jgi:tetratricopeptide (TPR) repeat protein